VADHLRDKTDNFRGGVRIEMSKFHVTLEQGGSTFKTTSRFSPATRTSATVQRRS